MLRSIASISVATVLSRVTGYGRWMAQAAVLAGGLVADAFTASILLPSLIYELFMGGILYSIFIPVLVDRITTHGEEDARRLTNALFTLVLPLMVVLSVVGIAFAGPLVGLVTNWQSAENLSPAEVEEVQGLAVLFFRIFVLQMFFYGISTVGTGVLQAHRRFFLPTFAPVLNNLLVIGSFAAYYFLRENDPRLALYVLASGVTAGVAVMALALVPTMLELGYRPRPQFGHPALLLTARLAGPMVVLVAASVGFQFFSAYLAMGFEAVAELTYAFTIFSLPYGVFVVAITTALMPELSEKYSLRDADGYRDTFSFGLRTMAFVVVPSAVGMISLSEPLVGVLYEHLNFGPRETDLVSGLLVVYAAGLLGYSVYFYLVRAFYSRQNTKTPAALNVVIFLLYAALAYGLSQVWGLTGVVVGLTVAYSALAVLSLAAMRRETGRLDGRRLLDSVLKALVSGTVMYAVARLGTSLLGVGTTFAERLFVLIVVGGVSLAAYLGVAFLLGAEEPKSVVTLLRRRSAGKTAR
ncbi:MAG TPA: murein biosynthesis integral membrane protein MurJ [Rubrobacter sp.]